jgi:hypothetical protein
VKKDDLALGVQVLANVGVLASLVFLAVEVRGNTVAMRSQEIGSLFEQDQALLATTIEREMGALYVKSLYRPAELSMEELQRITSLLSTRMNILRRVHQAYEDGVARQSDWETRVNATPIYLGTPFGLIWWAHIKADYSEEPEFVQAVDSALRDSPIVPDDEWLLELERSVRNVENVALDARD